MPPVQVGGAANRFYAAFRRLHSACSTPRCAASSAARSVHNRQIVPSAAAPGIRQPQWSASKSRPQHYLKSNRPNSLRLHSTDSSAHDNEATALSTHIRKLMRHVPHPVVVITASERPVEAGLPQYAESTLRAMTASSFNTVALDPTPIVSFNVKLPSTTYDALSARGTFLVHLVSGSAAGARVANAFTKGKAAKAFEDLAKSKAVAVYFGPGTDGAPLMAGEGVTKVLRCRVLKDKCVTVGGHVVVLGEVLGIIGPALDTEDSHVDGLDVMGLMYVDQRYREVGREISPKPLEPVVEQQEAPMQRTIGLNLRRGDEAATK